MVLKRFVEFYRLQLQPITGLEISLTIQNIERNEIYMMSIMLNKLNEFGRKVQVDMVYVKSGKN